MEDSSFTKALTVRYSALRQSGPLSDEALVARVDSLEAELSDGPAERNFQRWPVIGKWVWPNAYVETSYGDAVQFLRTWLPQRMAWLDGAIGLKTISASSPAEPAGEAASLSPNPGKTEVRLRGLAPSTKGAITFSWFNASGAVVQLEHLASSSSVILTPRQPGLYFWRASNSDGVVGSGKWFRR